MRSRYLAFLTSAGDLEPVEAVAGQGQQVGQLTDRREVNPAGQLDRRVSVVLRQIQFYWLREAGEIVDTEDQILLAAGVDPSSQVGQHARVGRPALVEIAEPEGRVLAADLQHPAGPVQQRGR